MRRQILLSDIRLDVQKENGGTRSQGGDFHLPFWADVKTYMSGKADLSDLTAQRVLSNKAYSRLYPVLAEGIIDLVNEKLRWSNEEVEILPQSVHGILKFEDLGATIRIKDAISARVKGDYTRVVYPYLSHPGR